MFFTKFVYFCQYATYTKQTRAFFRLPRVRIDRITLSVYTEQVTAGYLRSDYPEFAKQLLWICKAITLGKERCHMDIAGLSTAMSMSKVQTDWGMKMLSKTMDAANTQGSQLAQMIASVPTAQMELSVNPGVGGQFDLRI